MAPLQSRLSASNANSMFNTVYAQAHNLVEKDAYVMPFTSPNGHVHMLQHVKPDTVYVQESLAGENGALVERM